MRTGVYVPEGDLRVEPEEETTATARAPHQLLLKPEDPDGGEPYCTPVDGIGTRRVLEVPEGDIQRSNAASQAADLSEKLPPLQIVPNSHGGQSYRAEHVQATL